MKRKTFFLALVVLVGLVAGACLGSSEIDKRYIGRVLTFDLTDVRRVDRVEYVENGLNWVVEPESEGHKLVLIHLALINQEAGQVSVVVNEQAAVLVDKERDEYRPLDAQGRAREVSEPARNPQGVGRPPMWGNYDLKEGFEVRGWLYFEVPKDRELDYLRWDVTDALQLDL